MNLKKFYFSLLFVFFAFSINAEELKNNNSSNAFNVYTGMFDFSDDGKKLNANWFSTSKRKP